MSFHRKTFLVWLTTMSLFVAGMLAVTTVASQRRAAAGAFLSRMARSTVY
jgi:hypothetical protein